MAEEKKRSMIPLVISVILFVAGVVLGYYIWGFNKEKQVDYKNFLQETINYIATLEHKNKKLLDEVDTLETEMNMLQQKQTTSTVQSTDQIDTLSARISALEKENLELKTAISENNRLVQENQELKLRVQELLDEINAGKTGVPPLEPSASDVPDKQQEMQ
jgi:Tfp pilus assembly protein PilN